jgi:uncharacterized protein
LKFVLLFLIALIPVLSTSQARAQSFNCARAEKPDEILICHHRDLAALDEQLAGLYSQRLSIFSGSERQRFKREQRAWLRSRYACGSNYQCVLLHYQSRILALGGSIGSTVNSGRSSPDSGRGTGRTGSSARSSGSTVTDPDLELEDLEELEPLQ